MPQLGEFAVPIGTFVEQIENFLFTFMDHENKHDFHFVVQMKQKLDNRKKAIQSRKISKNVSDIYPVNVENGSPLKYKNNTMYIYTNYMISGCVQMKH